MEQKSKNLWLIIGIVVVVAIIAVVMFWQKGPKTEEPVVPTQHEAPPEIPLEEQIPGKLPNQTPSAEFKPGEDIEVIYTDAGFAPQTLTIKVGKVVTFKNLSSAQMWPASALHPTHDVYPEKGGCIGSKFDACRGVNRNESWSFKFTFVGTWKYHDHLSPSHFGTIIVGK